MNGSPFIDPRAALFEESGGTDGTWPCLGRRRHHDDEWDDYISLYDMRLDVLQGAATEDVFPLLAEVRHVEINGVTGRTMTESEADRTCSVCGDIKESARGKRVHESRAHGLRSERADYYKEWRG